MLPSVYNLPTGYRNDTYGPINFTFTNATGGAILLDNASGLLQVKNKINRDVVLQWGTQDNSMTISGNKLTLSLTPRNKMNLFEDSYIYDLQLNTGEVTKTYLKGELPIIGDVTEV